MKSKVILVSLLALAFTGNIMAQDIEHDDMYFNSKDRAKLRSAQKANELAFASIKRKQREEDDQLNPTDSYSARNVNPEYTSRSKSQIAKSDEQDYFVNNYQFNRSSNYNNFNNSFNNWYNSGWYRPNFWGPSIYAWNSPYYGYYDSWNSPWYDPYWGYNGYSSAYSYYYGQNYNYGWGGMYNYWNRPYYSGSSFYGYGSGFGLASNWYWNNYRPTSYVVINNSNTVDNGRDVVHGRRPMRSTYYATQNNDTRTRTTVGSYTRDDNSSGRTRTEYYNNTWRYNNYSGSNNNNSSSYDSRSQTQYNRSSSWNNNNSDSNSSWGNSSRSSSSFDSGGGARSHSSYTPSSSGGGGGSSGGGGGRSRRD